MAGNKKTKTPKRPQLDKLEVGRSSAKGFSFNQGVGVWKTPEEMNVFRTRNMNIDQTAGRKFAVQKKGTRKGGK